MRFLKGALIMGALFGVVSAANAVPEEKLEPTFKDLGHIHGYFTNPAGEGLSGLVVLKTESGRIISQHDTFAFRKGRFDIDNLVPGRYRLGIASVGTNVIGLEAPEDLRIEVLPKKVVRPRLVAD